MEASTDSAPPSSSSSLLRPNRNPRIPEDTVFYAIYSDSALSGGEISSSLQLHILDSVVSPYLRNYVWQHDPFDLSPYSPSSSSLSSSTRNSICQLCGSPPVPHLHGKVRYGDNLEDEWFVVFLLNEISRKVPSVSIRVWDTDGEFLLIEAAFSLPRWINPENSANRVFVRRGELHILPRDRFPSNPSLADALGVLSSGEVDTRAPEKVQAALNKRICGYPERARANMHRARVRVPLPVAQVLKHEPCLISLAVEGFYDRDVDSMKYASRMEKFLKSDEGGVDIVISSVVMSRAMYGQLVQQNFVAPKCYPMPSRDEDPIVYAEAELGMKIACGFEMMYHERRQAGEEGKGSSLDTFIKALESHGHFEGLLPGSKEYRRRMDDALECHRNTIVFSRAREMLNAPVRRIDEILSLPYYVDDFKGLELPPGDDDSWLYNGEDELNAAILERQKEMENFELQDSQRREKRKIRDQKVTNSNSSILSEDFNLGDIAKTMQAFVQKVSSFEGAEVPENRDSKEVELDVDRFIKDMESVIGPITHEETARDVPSDEGDTSSLDMDFDESEDESDTGETPDGGVAEDTFMQSYSDALNEELKATTLKKSFIRAHQQPSNNDGKGTTSYGGTKEEDMDEEDFTPVDVDVNLVKSFLDSYSSQQGLPGPTSNLLGLMGLKIPQQNTSKGK